MLSHNEVVEQTRLLDLGRNGVLHHWPSEDTDWGKHVGRLQDPDKKRAHSEQRKAKLRKSVRSGGGMESLVPLCAADYEYCACEGLVIGLCWSGRAGSRRDSRIVVTADISLM